MNKYILSILIFSFIHSAAPHAKEYLSPEELEKWFNSDDELPINKVNDGKLIFLETKPKENIFHSEIKITVDQNSIDNGWVSLSQCYYNLDPVARTAVVYRPYFFKNLKIISSKNIRSSKVEGHKVFLNNVSQNASLCVTANARNFYQNKDNSFSLVNGPYHRRFLDGYFPYHLKLNIHYSPNLKFSHSSPQPQAGFNISQLENALFIDTLFEGKLKTEFRFNLTP